MACHLSSGAVTRQLGILQEQRVPCYCLESTTRSRARYDYTTSRYQSTIVQPVFLALAGFQGRVLGMIPITAAVLSSRCCITLGYLVQRGPYYVPHIGSAHLGVVICSVGRFSCDTLSAGNSRYYSLLFTRTRCKKSSNSSSIVDIHSSTCMYW